MNPTLKALLDGGADFDAEFEGGLSNHLPMTLLALQRLGAGDVRLSAFAARYATRLTPAPTLASWPAGDSWSERFGQVQAWPAYRDLFRQWLGYEEATTVLAQVLPPLMTGCGGAAFHGLIRAAYAVQSGHSREIADALAYWASRHLHLGTLPADAGGDLDLATTLAKIPRVKSSAPLIFERMQAVAEHPEFLRAASQLTIDEHTLPAMAQHAAQLFASSGNFVALHLLTSAHALRTLLPFIEEVNAAVRSYWCAYAAAVSAGAAVLGEAPVLLPWPAIVQAALASDDEHVIKLVDSCREEEHFYGGTVWQLAASRAITVPALPDTPTTPRKRPPGKAARA